MDPNMVNESDVDDGGGGSMPPPSPSRVLPTLFKLDPTMLSKTEGWVWKKGGISTSGIRRRNWKKRWFQLIEQRTDSYPKYDIEYYDKPGGVLKGTIDLEGAEVFTEERNKFTLKRNRFEWQILLANGITILLASYIDRQDRDDWVTSINMVVAYLVKMRRASNYTLEGYDPLYEEEAPIHDTGKQLAQNCQAFGPGLFGAEAGQLGKFFVQMHDLAGNQIDVGGMPFTARLEDDEVLYHIRVVDHGDGSYSAHYVIKRPGTYKLSVQLNDIHHVYGSPYEIQVMPSRTFPSQCTGEGSALQSVSLGEETSFLITSRDMYGNPKPRGGDPFEVGIMGPAQLTELTDNENGTYTCCLQGRAPQDLDDLATHSLLLMVTLHGKHIAGSPFQPMLNVNQTFMQAQYRNSLKQAPESDLPDAFETGFTQGDYIGSNGDQMGTSNASVSKVPDNLPRHRPSVAWGSKNRGGGGGSVNDDRSVRNHKGTGIMSDVKPLSSTHTGSVSRLQMARDKALLAKNAAGGGGGGSVVSETTSKSSKLSKLTARLSLHPEESRDM